MPTEKYGFSNNAKGTMGPAKYDEAKFVFNGQEMTVLINVM